MMDKRVFRRVRLGRIALLLPILVGATFTWNGPNPGDWNVNVNWTGATAGYPDDNTDDAIITDDDTYTIVLTTECIDELRIEPVIPQDGNSAWVKFESKDTANTLSCDSVKIVSPSSGFGPTQVQVLDNAKIETVDGCP